MRCPEPGCMLRLAHAGAHVVTHRRFRGKPGQPDRLQTTAEALVDSLVRIVEALEGERRGTNLWHARQDAIAALRMVGHNIGRKNDE